jgi:hypothetical protein
MPFQGFLANGEAWDGLEAVEGGHPHQTTLLRNALIVFCIVVVVICKKTTTMENDDRSNDKRHRANDNDNDNDEEEEEDDKDDVPNADPNHQASNDNDNNNNNYVLAAMRGGMPTLTIAKRKVVNDVFVELFGYKYRLTCFNNDAIDDEDINRPSSSKRSRRKLHQRKILLLIFGKRIRTELEERSADEQNP